MDANEYLPADLLTVPEAADLLRCHQATVLRWIMRGKLTGYRFGRRWKVSRSALLAKVERKGPAMLPPTRKQLERERAAEKAELAALGYG
jgi:excisionase family DNA binding protein